MKYLISHHTHRLWCLMFFILGCWQINFAQIKTVQVSFEILEEKYKDAYAGEIDNIEQGGTALIINMLQTHYPYLAFDDETGSVPLDFTILRQPSTVTLEAQHQVDINMIMPNVSGGQDHAISFVFRDADQFIEVLPSTPEGFLLELEAVVTTWLDNEHSLIIDAVLSKVSLAERAHPDATNKSWVLPFAESEVGIGKESEFLIKGLVETPDIEQTFSFNATCNGKVKETSTAYPEEYRGKMLALIDDIQHLDKMDHPDLKIAGIFLLRYFKSTFPESVSPAAFNLPDE